MLALSAVGCPGKKDKDKTPPKENPKPKEASITVTGDKMTIPQGGEEKGKIVIDRTNYEGEVTVELSVPEGKGITAPKSVTVDKKEATVDIKVAGDAKEGTVEIGLLAKGKDVKDAKGALDVTIKKKAAAPPSKDSIKLTVPSDVVEVKQGDHKEVKLTLKREGDKAAGDVELKYKVDAKAKDKITIKKGDKIAKGSNDVTIEVHAAADAEPGTYDVAITASAGDGVPASEGTLHVKVNKK
jgi:uncharacterized membrane protein